MSPKITVNDFMMLATGEYALIIVDNDTDEELFNECEEQWSYDAAFKCGDRYISAFVVAPTVDGRTNLILYTDKEKKIDILRKM